MKFGFWKITELMKCSGTQLRDQQPRKQYCHAWTVLMMRVGNWKINWWMRRKWNMRHSSDKDKESNKCRISDSLKMVQIVQIREGRGQSNSMQLQKRHYRINSINRPRKKIHIPIYGLKIVCFFFWERKTANNNKYTNINWCYVLLGHYGLRLNCVCVYVKKLFSSEFVLLSS